MEKQQRRPGDLILDRYLPDANEETRERAREALRSYALMLIRIGKRRRMLGKTDSDDEDGRLRIESAPDARSP